ncbi:MAG: amino acid ABC transporter permease [Propionibacteriaceae bacterium]|jgi:polar amino acid transport system permease protein|nr:amino acid ABC transporter permease [Propionibacteriaceae bacterium]
MHDWEVLFQGVNFERLLGGLWTSFSIALVAVLFSLVVGVPLGIAAASRNRWLRGGFQVYLQAIRVLPPLVLLFVFYFYLSLVTKVNLSAYASAITVFTLWGAAEMGDLVRGAVTSIPKHQYESAAALGLNPVQVQLRIVVPQSVRRLLPQAVNLVTRMIKTTSLVVLIGVVEVLKVGQQIIDVNRFEYPSAALWVYAAVFFMYFAVCYSISKAAAVLERRLA